MSDFYEILGVSRGALKDEISKAYRKMALKYHPDRNLDNPEKAAEMFKKIGRAYEVLSDEDKKSVYDRFGEEGLNNGGMSEMPQGFNPFDLFGGPFGNVFGGPFGGPFGAAGPGGPPKGNSNDPGNLTFNIKCSLKETYTGQKRHENVERLVFCNGCDNTGFRDKKNHTCSSCNGRGIQILVHQLGPGMVQQSTRTCISCKGSGNDANHPICGKCNGKKRIAEMIRVDFEIKKGIKTGMNYVIRGKGHQISSDTYSDIVITLEVQNDPIYTRKGNNLYRKLDISLRKALLGFDMILEHLDGKKIVIKSSEIIKPQSNRVIPKLGFLSNEGTYGDYFIEFNVVFPERFSSKQLKALDLVLHKDLEEPNLSSVDSLNHYRLEHNSSSPLDEESEHQGGPQPQNVQCAQQ
jgi:DnaJ family protein A protein 2